jgi:hypothetical protein
MILPPDRLRKILRRLEDYPELRDILHTPSRHDMPVETRYLLCLESLMNKFERFETHRPFVNGEGI